jgi:outer membrane protein TolC
MSRTSRPDTIVTARTTHGWETRRRELNMLAKFKKRPGWMLLIGLSVGASLAGCSNARSARNGMAANPSLHRNVVPTAVAQVGGSGERRARSEERGAESGEPRLNRRAGAPSLAGAATDERSNVGGVAGAGRSAAEEAPDERRAIPKSHRTDRQHASGVSLLTSLQPGPPSHVAQAGLTTEPNPFEVVDRHTANRPDWWDEGPAAKEHGDSWFDDRPTFDRPTGVQLVSQDVPLPAPAASEPPTSFFPDGRYLDEADDRRADDAVSAEHGEVYPVNLASALQLASGRNPQVNFANERIQEAFAQWSAAEILWLPSIRVGLNYNTREGRLQDVEGEVFDISRSAFFTGFGAGGVGAASPAFPGLAAQFRMNDALYMPRIAQSATAARQYAATAATNDVLLETALAYLELLNAAQLRAITAETLHNSRQLTELTADYARTGQGAQADADRAAAELAVRENELERAEEAAQVASARLAQMLSMDPTIAIEPLEPTVVPIELASRPAEVQELVATGLSHRPELAENQMLVSEAVHRLKREQHAPLLPSVLLGVSYGGFGGSPGGDAFGNFGDRFDFDAVAFWEVRNLGFGEKAARAEAQSRVNQARWQQVRTMDLIAREVVEAHAQVQARRRQIANAETGVQAAADSYRRNMQRIRDGVGLPVEVLQSIQALDAARREYLRAVVTYNEAQFRLHRALGWPIS